MAGHWGRQGHGRAMTESPTDTEAGRSVREAAERIKAAADRGTRGTWDIELKLGAQVTTLLAGKGDLAGRAVKGLEAGVAGAEGN